MFKNPSFRHSLFVSQKLQVAPFYLMHQPLFTVLCTSIPVHVSSPRRRRSCAVRFPSQEGTSSFGYVAQHNTGGDHARIRSTVGTAHTHILPASPSSSLWSALGSFLHCGNLVRVVFILNLINSTRISTVQSYASLSLIVRLVLTIYSTRRLPSRAHSISTFISRGSYLRSNTTQFSISGTKDYLF